MRKRKLFKYIIFTVVFTSISNWIAINLSLSSFGQKKAPVTVIKDQEIQQLILRKTGLEIKTIKIAESPHPFGMMIGIPFRPQLVLSRGLYDDFSSEEMEYVVLHEAGHYVLWHGVKELALWLVLFFIGLVILRKVEDFKRSIVVSILLGLIFGILMIQLGKLHELQADSFTVKKMESPKGMITATKKFQSYQGKRYSTSRNKLIQVLFIRSNPYENRIKMAQEEINKRK